MRVIHVAGDALAELAGLPDALPADGFVWAGCTRAEFEGALAALQAALQRWGIAPIVDLHVSDLLNQQLPSHFDYTSWYDLLVFRRLVAGAPEPPTAQAPTTLVPIDTKAVGFVVFDRVLLTIHPDDGKLRDYFVQRLAGAGGRMPSSPADLTLRIVNHIVDSYLELRRRLTRELGLLQQGLLDPQSRFADWTGILEARNTMHLLEDTCEDQRAAVQEWIDSIDEWPAPADPAAQRERELLRIRARDVHEHVERVLAHVRRLEQSAEAAVQMHYSAVGHRTNEIMRTLTVLTAVFLPLNLITGFFGMNFEALPLIHTSKGFWIAFGTMVVIGIGLALYFWRKHYLVLHR